MVDTRFPRTFRKVNWGTLKYESPTVGCWKPVGNMTFFDPQGGVFFSPTPLKNICDPSNWIMISPEKNGGENSQILETATTKKSCAGCSHGSGKWLQLKGSYYLEGPIFSLNHDYGRKGMSAGAWISST